MLRFVFLLFITEALLFGDGQDRFNANDKIKGNKMLIIQSVDHSKLDLLLSAYVSESGFVDYAAIQKNQLLDEYLEVLSGVVPEELPEKEAIAYWINAYNAFTIKLIVDNFPVGSIREITPFRIKGVRLAIPKINSPFEYKLAEINGRVYSLDDIEHKILRKKFDEPRIHFALVCASVSCPPLRREAFTGERLDIQLDEQARIFLNDTTKNRIAAGEIIYLSRIFDWFQSDFGGSKASLQFYLAQYFEGDLRDRLEAGSFKINYLPYNWSLNETLGR